MTLEIGWVGLNGGSKAKDDEDLNVETMKVQHYLASTCRQNIAIKMTSCSIIYIFSESLQHQSDSIYLFMSMIRVQSCPIIDRTKLCCVQLDQKPGHIFSNKEPNDDDLGLWLRSGNLKLTSYRVVINTKQIKVQFFGISVFATYTTWLSHCSYGFLFNYLSDHIFVIYLLEQTSTPSSGIDHYLHILYLLPAFNIS